MGQVFISFYRADEEAATALAKGIETAGLSTWYYTRDSRPGRSYLRQIATAITACEAIVVIVSRSSVQSEQMTSEIVQGFEQKKHFVPILEGLSHFEFQTLQPEWRAAFGAATSIVIPKEGVETILPALIEGLLALGRPWETAASLNPTPSAQPPIPTTTQLATEAVPFVPYPEPIAPPVKVELTARFDHLSYPHGEDTLAYWLAELQVEPEAEEDPTSEEDRIGADIALILDVSGSMQKPNRYPLLREAVGRFVSGLGSEDRVSITLFTERSQTVVPFMNGDKAAANPDQIVRAMDQSGMLFGPDTLLAPGLRLALDGFGSVAKSGGRVRRTYILTDGELTDPAECKTVLYGFRTQLVEVHLYGFGEDFDAATLKRLVSDQIGGTVKPIVNEEDITRTFSHVAAVNRRLVGHNGKLMVALRPCVVCGDAWVYQPHGRYLGEIRDRRVEHVFGGIEAGRRYSILLEVRLPIAEGTIATVEAEWVARDQLQTYRIEVGAARSSATPEAVPDVRRAVDILQVLRAADDKNSQLASYKARRELAVMENRDPELIAALDKLIAELAEPNVGPGTSTTWKRFSPRCDLTAREQQLLESDTSSVVSWPLAKVSPEMEAQVLEDLNSVLTSGVPASEVIEMAITRLLMYVGQEDYQLKRAADLLEELALHVGISRRAASQYANQFITLAKENSSAS